MVAFFRRYWLVLVLVVVTIALLPFIWSKALGYYHWANNTAGLSAHAAQNELEKVRGDVSDKKAVSDVNGRIKALRDKQATLADVAAKSGNMDELNRVSSEIADLERDQAYNLVRAAEIEDRAAKARKMAQDIKDCGTDLECVRRVEKANQPKILVPILEQQDKAARDAEVKRLVEEALKKEREEAAEKASAEAKKKKASLAPAARPSTVTHTHYHFGGSGASDCTSLLSDAARAACAQHLTARGVKPTP